MKQLQMNPDNLFSVTASSSYLLSFNEIPDERNESVFGSRVRVSPSRGWYLRLILVRARLTL